jgi:hypothetical protein
MPTDPDDEITDQKKRARRGIRSTGRKTEVVQEASRPVQIPAHIEAQFRDDAERQCYLRLTQYRAQDDWRPADLDLLASAARAWRSAQNEGAILDCEDSVIEGERGEVRLNPRIRAQAIYLSQYERVLGLLGCRSTGHDQRTTKKRAADVAATRRVLQPGRHPLLEKHRGGLAIIDGGRAHNGDDDDGEPGAV